MSDPIKENDPRCIWRDQPEEKLPVKLEQIVNLRREALYSSTRLEIIMSIGAALVLVGVVAWRLTGFAHERVLGFGLAAVIVWIAISLYWFRHRIWRGEASRPDAVAATGLEYYRIELERRRDHLRNGWLWYGPLCLACILLFAILTGKANLALEPLPKVLPLVVLLAAWTGFGLWRRTLQANEIQREIDEIELLCTEEAGDLR
jgi:hypothetical protein